MRRYLLPLLFMASPVLADVTLPPLISDNMLLQQPAATLWGKADPGEKVTVQLGSLSAETTADDHGNWRLQLEGLKPGNAGTMTVAGKANRLEVRNVAVGDVWLASGQSNMQWSVDTANNAGEEIKAADFPGIRMFTVKRQAAPEPVGQVEGAWKVAMPGSISKWSAAGYFFARDLHQALQTPVGVISSNVGGTRAESWTPREWLEADPVFRKALTGWDTRMANYPAAKAKYDEALAAWEKEAAQAREAGQQPAGKKPGPPIGPDSPHRPAGLYNAMIAGATPYTIKGAIWYQGEANTSQAGVYSRLLTTMVESWRKQWGSDFPFLIVQLANFMAPKPEPGNSSWAALREAQRIAARELPGSGLAVAIDIGDEKNIHPKNKQEVGRRLSLVARAKVYGEKLVYSGPAFREARFEEGKVAVLFDAGSAAGLKTGDGEPVKGFALAGADGKFYWAEASIETDGAEGHLVVKSAQVPEPVAIRYAWADNPAVNLINEAGLPAVPFQAQKP